MAETEIARGLDELARLLALLCRRTGPEDETLQDFIVELSQLGLPTTRVATLAGTSANYANVALSRAKQKRKTK